MSRKNRLRQQQRAAQASQGAAQQQAPDPDEVLDPMDILAGDAVLEADDDEDLDAELGEDLDEDLADGGTAASASASGDGGKAPAADPLAEIQRQYEEVKAAREAAEARVKEKEAAEARYRAEAEAERKRAGQERADREAAEAGWREEQKKRAELEEYRIKADREQLVSHKAVLEHAFAAAEASRTMAQRAYAEAMAAGDYEKAAEFQAAISDAVFEKRRLAEGLEHIKEKVEAPLPEYVPEPVPERAPRQEQQEQQERQERQPEPAPADPWEAAIINYSESDKKWLREHKDDLATSQERQLLAQAAHVTATTRYGLKPGTDDYYNYLDEHMGYSEPDDTGSDPEPEPAPNPASVRQQPPRQAPQPRPKPAALPSAPPSRSNDTGGGSAGGEIRLSRDEKLAARDMGMTYARYYELKQKIATGQTHLKFWNEGYSQ